MMRLWLLLPALALLACREPTQITLEIVKENTLECQDLRGTIIRAGSPDDFDQREPSALTTACDSATGRIGSLVIVPSSARDATITVEVVAGFGTPVEECLNGSTGPGCIVARRRIRYLPGRSLTVLVELRASCKGVQCGRTLTCSRGQCVDSLLDPNTCRNASGCDLPTEAPDAGGVRDAAMGAGAADGSPPDVASPPDAVSLPDAAPPADATPAACVPFGPSLVAPGAPLSSVQLAVRDDGYGVSFSPPVSAGPNTPQVLALDLLGQPQGPVRALVPGTTTDVGLLGATPTGYSALVNGGTDRWLVAIDGTGVASAPVAVPGVQTVGFGGLLWTGAGHAFAALAPPPAAAPQLFVITPSGSVAATGALDPGGQPTWLNASLAGDEIGVTWTAFEGQLRRCRLARFSRSAVSLGPSLPVSAANAHCYDPRSAARVGEGGTEYGVAWASPQNGQNSVSFASFDHQGKTLSSGQLSTPGVDSCCPQVVAVPGGFAVAYLETESASRGRFVVRLVRGQPTDTVTELVPAFDGDVVSIARYPGFVAVPGGYAFAWWAPATAASAAGVAMQVHCF